MARVLAICDKCNTFFPSVFNLGAGATNIVFKNCGAGPCPKCGGNGKILDGVYNAVGEAIEAFIGQQNIEGLKRLLSILESAKESQLKHEEVVANIKQAAPEFSNFTDFLPKTRAELYGFLVVIIMLITSLLSSEKKSFDKHELKEQMKITINSYEENTINNYYEAKNKGQSAVKPTIPVKELSTPKKRVGRNEPCPCGSNKKYKKCCGK